MANLLGASWLTTVIGILGAILNVLTDIHTNGSISIQTIINSASLLGLGAAAKSYNVSGGPNK
jgi:hypothetical protein